MHLKCGSVAWFGVFLVLVVVLLQMSGASVMGDECDWTGSGLTNSASDKGVTPVYLRCSAGKVKWMYPRGALRILLRLPGQDRDFRACIKIKTTSKPDRPVTKIYLEGPRSLILLHGGDDQSKPIRCFSSKRAQAAIYIEATDERSFDRQFTELQYDLEKLPQGYYGYDRSEECRPCSNEELAHVFCSSDLVTRGTIHSVDTDDRLDQSIVTVKVTKLIRHSAPDDEDLYQNANEVVPDGRRHVTVTVPQYCGINHGLGEFVFMARRKLGDLTLVCAPRLEQWTVLANRMNEQGRSHCVLRS